MEQQIDLTQAYKDKAQIKINYKKCKQILDMNLNSHPWWFTQAWDVIQLAYQQVQVNGLVLMTSDQKKWMNQTGWKLTELLKSLDNLFQNTQVLDWNIPTVQESASLQQQTTSPERSSCRYPNLSRNAGNTVFYFKRGVKMEDLPNKIKKGPITIAEHLYKGLQAEIIDYTEDFNLEEMQRTITLWNESGLKGTRPSSPKVWKWLQTLDNPPEFVFTLLILKMYKEIS